MIVTIVGLFFYSVLSTVTNGQGPGTCETLSLSSSKLVNPCVGIVDYPYFLPAGYSNLQLEKQVLQVLNSPTIYSLSPECRAAMVELTCARVYKKCYSGINFTQPLTYNMDIYSPPYYPLPFVR